MRILVLLVALVGWTYVADAKRISDTVIFIDAKVVKIAIVESSQIMTCDKGSDAGIGKAWTAKLVVGGRQIADAKLIRFEKKTSVVKADVTFDQIPKEITCRFFPPPI